MSDATCIDVFPRASGPQCGWGTVKRAFRMGDGALVRDARPELRFDIRDPEASPKWPPGSDFWPFKTFADVVVTGKAFGPGGRPVQAREVSVRVGNAAKHVRVFGTRYIEWSPAGSPLVGPPEPFVEIDLVYTNAYGGVDARVPVPAPASIAEAMRLLGDHPGAYPRNQSGKGYLVVDAPVVGLELPNLEDPSNLLTSGNLIVRDPARWHLQPLPWFLGWHFPAMFPRAAYLGAEYWYPLASEAVLEEVSRGLMVPDWRDRVGRIEQGEPAPPIYFQEASLGMTFHDLREGTPIELVGMHPERERITFALPPFPRLEIEVEGDRQAVAAKILHVVITPHEEKVEITWAGIRESMPRAFFPGIHGHIPITLWVDGTPVPFETPEPIYEKIKRAEEQGLLPTRPARRRPGEPGYAEVMGELLPELPADRARDQVSIEDAPRLGAIDPAAGRVLLAETDWELPGPVPLAVRRSYSSSMSWRAGTLGLGWSHSLEQAVWEQDGWILYRMEDGREIGVPLPGGAKELGLGTSVHHPNAGATIHRRASDAYAVRLADGRRFGFTRIDEALTVGARRARLTEIFGADGSVRPVRYDALGRLDRVSLPGGRALRFEHDERGRLVRVFAPVSDGSTEQALAVAFTLDAEGQLREALDGAGNRTKYAYEGRLLVERVSPAGERRRFRYTGLGASARAAREELGEHAREVSFSPERRVAGLSTATGHSRSIAVDERGEVVRVLDFTADETTRTIDEASGLPSAMTTPDGETTYLYDAHYHLADVSAPDAGSVALEHDAEGRLTSLRDADGHLETAHWDSLGRLVARTDRAGAGVIYEHDGDGPLAALVTPAELRVELARDPASHAVVAVRSPLGDRRATRDALGRVIEVADELGRERRFRYDPCGRVKEVVLPEDVRVTCARDAAGRIVEWSDGAGAIRIERDATGRVLHLDEGAGEGPRLHRDAEGRVTMVESEAFDYWELHRDAAGRVREESGFSGEAPYVLRDPAGRVRRAVSGAGRAEVKRDRAGRPIELAHADDTLQRFAWTPGVRLARAQDADRVVTFAHDGAGRILVERGAHELSSRYDASGRRVALDSSLGLALRVDRDALGRALRIVATQGTLHLQLELARDGAGRERERALPGGLEVRFGRDELGRVVRRAVAFGERELTVLDFAWAGLDRLVTVEDSQRGRRGHRHDARGRLVRVGGLDRALDPLGRVYRTAEKDDHVYEAGRLIEAYGCRYAYDAAGRRTAKTTALDEETRYAWDGAGRLAAVHLPGGDRVTYDYDGLGRLVRRRREARVTIPGVREPVWEATRETELVWDGLALLHELEGAKVTTWIREEGRLVGKLASDGAFAVLTDPIGLVTELTDATGNLAWRGTIDLFGAAAIDAASTACPWRFPGHFEDPDTGLAHAWLRVYDPETGAYLSPSPLGIVGGSHLYEYLPDPLSHASPLGLGRGYAALRGAVRSERLEAELVERFVEALDRGEGDAGPRERFDPRAARLAMEDPEAALFGPWDALRPERRVPPPSARLTRLPKHLGLSADEDLEGAFAP